MSGRTLETVEMRASEGCFKASETLRGSFFTSVVVYHVLTIGGYIQYKYDINTIYLEIHSHKNF